MPPPRAVVSEIEQEEMALGTWPRRLLHVPTLTSFEWQPGNQYGNAKNPSYNAVTYTWGRWRLPDHPVKTMPEVEAIPVLGVPWDIPRVDPNIFTNTQLLQVIQQARLQPWHSSPEVDYIWIDIACIDQRENEARAVSEIDRQVAIFSRALRVFAWTSSISSHDLGQIHQGLRSFVHGTPRATSTPDFLEEPSRLLVQMLSDPWFSSLWTLQEAFARPDAVFVSQQADRVSSVDADESFELSHLCYMASQVHKWATAKVCYKSRDLQDALGLLHRTGLVELSHLNFTAAFLAVQNRVAQREEDRVYGIQQLFRFQPRKLDRNLNALPRTMPELEEGLTWHLLSHHPVLSQLFIHTSDIPPAAALRPSKDAKFPPLPGILILNFMPGGTISTEQEICRFSTKNIQGKTWAWFESYICNFQDFERQCLEAERATYNEAQRMVDNSSSFAIYLDKTSIVSSCPGFASGEFQNLSKQDTQKQRGLAKWMSQTFPRQRLLVLELCSLQAHEQPYWDTYGLLMLLEEYGGLVVHRRLGFCCWEDHSWQSRRQAYHDEWTFRAGLLY
ncbi:hypothetical protein G7054_g11122 [Neopestalotiopsis clavispora]|nr:hypothetical protein G7054_g11122 [Neopestalotiopsis clavispora]